MMYFFPWGKQLCMCVLHFFHLIFLPWPLQLLVYAGLTTLSLLHTKEHHLVFSILNTQNINTS